MGQIVVFANAVPTEIANALDADGYVWKATDLIDAGTRLRPEDGWSAALVLGADLENAIEFCRTTKRAGEASSTLPLLLVVPAEQSAGIDLLTDLCDDFILSPFRSTELSLRLRKLTAENSAGSSSPQLVEYGELVLNLATFQAAVGKRPLDMTYMEYQLLKHFATNPNRTFSRQELLRQVWGYEYYGGARTVDVHVRRLRAKLGDEYAQLIQTVRSVGYIFGRTRWQNED